MSRPLTATKAAAAAVREAAEDLAAVLRDRPDNGPHDALTATDAAMLVHCEAVAYHVGALDRLNGCATRPQGHAVSADGNSVECVTDYIGGSEFETDAGGWFSVKPDGEAQTVTLTHYVTDDDLDEILLTTDDLDDLIDALLSACTACIDALPPRPCFDCGRDVGERLLNEAYVIHNALWEGATCMDNGVDVLCIECLEKRLGRELTPADFPDFPLNGPDVPASALLRSRRDGSVTTGKAAP